MKVLASVILTEALRLIECRAQFYVCAAIQDAETELRWAHCEEVSSNAMQIFSKYKPKTVHSGYIICGEWWPRGDPARLVVLKSAIELAVKRKD